MARDGLMAMIQHGAAPDAAYLVAIETMAQDDSLELPPGESPLDAGLRKLSDAFGEEEFNHVEML